MYLSRIQLNPERRRTRWLLSSPQRLHAEILNAFPEPPTGDRAGEPRVLWRVDTAGRKVHLFVSSPEPADLTKLTEEAGWNTAPGETKPYGDFLDRLGAGSAWSFRLVANPVRYEKAPDAGRGTRHAHTTVRYQEQWLADNAANHGFSVTANDGEPPFFALTERKVLRFTRGESKRTVTISTARFDGQLTVTDPAALRRALTAGIGPAKAYGCGLLTLARPRP